MKLTSVRINHGKNVVNRVNPQLTTLVSLLVKLEYNVQRLNVDGLYGVWITNNINLKYSLDPYESKIASSIAMAKFSNVSTYIANNIHRRKCHGEVGIIVTTFTLNA